MKMYCARCVEDEVTRLSLIEPAKVTKWVQVQAEEDDSHFKRTRVNKAVTVLKGNALCESHLAEAVKPGNGMLVLISL